MEECRGAQRLRGTPTRMMWWDQQLDFVAEEDGRRNLGFVLGSRRGGGSQKTRGSGGGKAWKTTTAGFAGKWQRRWVER